MHTHLIAEIPFKANCKCPHFSSTFAGSTLFVYFFMACRADCSFSFSCSLLKILLGEMASPFLLGNKGRVQRLETDRYFGGLFEKGLVNGRLEQHTTTHIHIHRWILWRPLRKGTGQWSFGTTHNNTHTHTQMDTWAASSKRDWSMVVWNNTHTHIHTYTHTHNNTYTQMDTWAASSKRGCGQWLVLVRKGEQIG
jgi:hypothetical protein